MAEEIPRGSAHSYPPSNQDSFLQGETWAHDGVWIGHDFSLLAFSFQLGTEVGPDVVGVSVKCPLLSNADSLYDLS